jgi:acetyltransferase-like isoleucine patch superfamily enzyme
MGRVIRRIFSSPWSIPYILLKKLICKVRSIYYSSKIDGGGGKIILTEPFIRFKFKKDKSSKLIVKGILKIIPHLGGNSPVVLTLSENSKFHVNGDFNIGQGVRIAVSNHATLVIGGREKDKWCGITSDTLIMVSKKIDIGKDFVCAWNIFISDSDWHSIEGQPHQADVIIGDHVWVANSCSILKGAVISDNSIVASHSKVTNKSFSRDSLLAGTPARVIKTNINWSL